MSVRSRTQHFVGIFVVAAMAWGFALPLVHLACGNTVDPVEMLCDSNERSMATAATHDHGASTERHVGSHLDESPAPGLRDHTTLLQCCQVDPLAVDHRATRVDLAPAPALFAGAVEVNAPKPDDATGRLSVGNPDPAAPVPLRLLFSVFLI